jgi:hypothetical protein
VHGGLDEPVFAVLGGLLRCGGMLGRGGLAELLVQPGDAVAGGVKLAGLGEGAGEVVCRAKTLSPALSWCFALLRLLSGTR